VFVSVLDIQAFRCSFRAFSDKRSDVVQVLVTLILMVEAWLSPSSVRHLLFTQLFPWATPVSPDPTPPHFPLRSERGPASPLSLMRGPVLVL